ncbi:MAG: hypothetical protein Q4F05_16560 [bacterium]|nr:hypothetical protein [bacterium]
MNKEKRKSNIVFYLFLLVCIAYVIFYIWHMVKVSSKPKYNADFKVGVVQTSDTDNVSYITYYDKDLKNVYTQKISNGDLGETYEAPQIAGNSVYMVPKRSNEGKDSKSVIALDMKTGKKTSYSIGHLHSTNLRVDANNIYTATSKDQELKLSKYIKSSKKTKSLTFSNTTLNCFKVSNSMLYAVLTTSDNKNILDIIDTKTMKVDSTVDLSSFKGQITDFVFTDTELYFIFTDDNSKGGLGSYNLVTKKTEVIDLTLEAPDQIARVNSSFVITSKTSNKVTVYNYAKNDVKTYELPTVPLLCKVTSTNLYYLDDTSIYMYDLKDFSLVKKEDVPIKTVNSNKQHLVTFFLK